MIYTVAHLLQLIEKGGYPIEPIISSWRLPFSTKQRQATKQLEKTGLVMDELCGMDQTCSSKPRVNVPVANVLEFIEANEEALSKDEEIVGEKPKNKGDPNPKFDLYKRMMDRVKGTHAFLWTIDYKFGEKDLVYFVTVNR